MSQIETGLGNTTTYQGLADSSWSSQCFKLAIASDNNHAEAYNNLGVLEARKGRNDQAVAFFQTAQNLAPHIFEPFYNQAKIADNVRIQKYISKGLKRLYFVN